MVFSLILASTVFSLNFSHATGKSNESLGVDNYIDNEGNPRVIHQHLAAVSKVDANKVNQNIIRLDNEPIIENSGLPPTWKDKNKSCSSSFKCIANFSTGWNDKKSIQISTKNTNSNTFSNIIGEEVPVKAKERYELITHLKNNVWSTQSHVKLQGFNETSKHWYQIEKCPSATNDSLDWKEYKCVITIESNVPKVRPVLSAGWSSQAGREAVCLV